jgi:hypothetical protein
MQLGDTLLLQTVMEAGLQRCVTMVTSHGHAARLYHAQSSH